MELLVISNCYYKVAYGIFSQTVPETNLFMVQTHCTQNFAKRRKTSLDAAVEWGSHLTVIEELNAFASTEEKKNNNNNNGHNLNKQTG